MPAKRLLLRNGLIFQLKLGLDAIRDILLSPIALIALVIDLATDSNPDQGYFNKLMAWGRFSDDWINLFSSRDPGDMEKQNIDNIIDQLEIHLKQKKLSESSKEQLTKYLELLTKTVKKANTQSNHEDQ